MDREFTAALRTGEPVAGSWISIGHPQVAEITSLLGFDFAVIDTEHTPNGLETVESLVRAVECGESTAIVRVPWNDPVRIKRALDVGATGLLIPMVETEDEARAAVEAMRYPPDGIRGMASSRASEYGLRFEEYVETANEALLTILQIETERGVTNAADIAAVEGVDALLIGPADLSASLGSLADRDDTTVTDAIDTVLDDSDVPVGTLAVTNDDIGRWVEQGFDFVIVGIDTKYLVRSAQDAKEAFEDAINRRNRE
jgi:2-keto-3-deoxy-L-rhamnonate aldolase RhmA